MKTKVVAFRVTEEQYNALQLEAVRKRQKISDVVMDVMCSDLEWMLEALRKETKRLEAKAKREAKKAATQQVTDGNA
ncbi:MAG: hypothetical protein ACO3DI_08815 [Ilumatobacteraceae bacterium]